MHGLGDNADTIAVVVPLYNHERYIAEALASVLSQTRKASEIIVIDDGSIDRGADIAEDMLRDVPGATVIRQQNVGAHNTINRAISMSRSRYVAVLNSDDKFHPDKLDRCIHLFNIRPSTGLIIGSIDIFDEYSTSIKSGITIDWLNRAKDFFSKSKNLTLSLMHENFAATTSNFVFSKELWALNGGFQPLRYCHDFDFLIAAARNSEVHFDAEKVHISYRVHPSNTIKENLDKIRIEIAGVFLQGMRPEVLKAGSTFPGAHQMRYFLEVVRAKNLDALLLALLPIRGEFGQRDDFYKAITDPAVQKRLSEVLAGSEISDESHLSDPGQLASAATVVGAGSISPLVAAIELTAFDKGGLEKVVLDSATIFERHNIRPVIFSVKPIGQLGEVAKQRGVTVIQLPQDGRDEFYRRMLVEIGADISMSHFSDAGYRIFQDLNIPNITFIHNVYAMLAGDALKNFLSNDRYVDRYISVSSKATQYASSKLGIDSSKIDTVPNGLILPEYEQRALKSATLRREDLGIGPNDYVFLNVASYNLHKSHYLMADAMRLLLRKRNDIRIICIGNEIYPPHVAQLREDLRAWGLEKNILMPGYFEDITPFHQMSNAFILPSLIEGWSIAMNEAMFFGKPMILSDTGGSSDVIESEDIGLIVPNEYGDLTQLDSAVLDEIGYNRRKFTTAPYLAHSMERFANNPDYWKAAGARGAAKLRARFDFSQTVQTYVQIIDTLMARGRR